MAENNQKVSKLGILIFSIAALFFLYEFFLRTFLGSFAKDVIHDLSLSAEQFALLGSGYYLAYALMQVPVGMLVDKFGVKLSMIVATVMCAIATFIFAHTDTFITGFFARLGMGFGSSFAFVILLVIVSVWFPRKHFAFLAGLSQFIGTLGPLLAGGPLVAYLATQHLTWRSALSTIAGVGIILSILSLLFVKSKSRSSNEVIYLNNEPSVGIRLEKMKKNTQMWMIALCSGCIYFPISLMGAQWGTYFLHTTGLSSTNAADMISVAWFSYGIGCPIIGALSDRLRRRTRFMALCGVFGVIATSWLIYFTPHHLWVFTAVFALLGLAASGQNIGFAVIAEHSQSDIRASAMGLNNGMMMLFGALLPPVVSYFISQAAHGSIQNLVTSDFTIGLSIMPIMYVCAIILSVFIIKETYGRTQHDPVIPGEEQSSVAGH